MKKSFYILLFIFLSLMGFGLFLNITQTTDHVLKKYAGRIKAQLDKDYAEVTTELSAPGFVQDAYGNELETPRQKRLYTKDYTVLAYQGDSLIHWYNNKLFLDAAQIHQIQKEDGAFFFKTSNAFTYLVKKNLPAAENGTPRYAVGIIPLKYAYQISKLAGSNNFHVDKNIPISINLDSEPTTHDIAGPAGGHQFLSAKKSFVDTPTQKKLILVFGLAFMIFLLLSNQVANHLSKREPSHGTFFLVAILSFVSIFIGYIDPATKLGSLGKLAETLKIEVLGSSLVVVFFYAISFVWLMVYLNKTYIFKENLELEKWKKFTVSIILNVSLMTGIVVVLEIYKQIVVWSEINISFLSLLERKLNSLLGLTLVLIALAALVLFALWMIKFIKQVSLSRIERAISILVGFVIVLGYLYLTDSAHNNATWYGTAILLPFALDYYTSDRPKREPYAIYLWFALIAIFASVSLYVFQNERELKEMSSYSHILAEERDTIGENLMLNLVTQISADSRWENTYLNEPFFFDSKEADLLILNYFEEDNYLSNNYSYNFYLYTDAHNSFEDFSLMNQGLSKAECRKIMNSSQQIGDSKLYLRNTDNGSYSYFLESRLKTNENAILVLELIAETSGNANINSPIFSSFDDQLRMRNIDQYKYSTFRNSECIRYKGELLSFYDKLQKKPKKGEELYFSDHNGHINYVYHSDNGNVVLMQKSSKGLYQLSSLFAMLFFLISILAVILNVLDRVFNFVPNGLDINLLPGNTFYAKIQSGFLIIIYISFFAIGVVTAAHFNGSNKKYHDGRLSRKSKTINTDIGFSLNKLPGTTSVKDLQKTVSDEIISLSKTHKMDVINFFDTKGKLVFSSKDEMYLKGITPREMDANTFSYLSKNKAALRIHPEQLGDVKFKSSYFAILHYGKLVGYMGIPYYTKEQARLSDLNDFVSNLLITYIVLFVMAIIFIVYGSNLIAKPIRNLSEGVKRNEEIEWKENDEFKGLVEAFNQSLRAKEIQHQLQVKVEKESAWRDMAKQVAHDIKNPLTPIQLHIQHLQKSIKDRRMDLDQIEERTDRVTQIILTQIKKLLRTVDSFQDIANEDIISKENVSINKILTDVAMLHEKEDSIEVLLNLPREEIFVHGNKGKLERVFANIVKNAVQAIPEDKNGVIVLQLALEGNQAIIKISDNGTGIPDHMTDKVFTPNFTTKNSGTGLGLHICKTIIESHNGKIDFATERDKGTSFTVQLKTSRIMSQLDHTIQETA